MRRDDGGRNRLRRVPRKSGALAGGGALTALRLTISSWGTVELDKRELRNLMRSAAGTVRTATRKAIARKGGGGRLYSGGGGSAYRGAYRRGAYRASAPGAAPVSVSARSPRRSRPSRSNRARGSRCAPARSMGCSSRRAPAAAATHMAAPPRMRGVPKLVAVAPMPPACCWRGRFCRASWPSRRRNWKSGCASPSTKGSNGGKPSDRSLLQR